LGPYQEALPKCARAERCHNHFEMIPTRPQPLHLCNPWPVYIS
jgi:hypothetical protein